MLVGLVVCRVCWAQRVQLHDLSDAASGVLSLAGACSASSVYRVGGALQHTHSRGPTSLMSVWVICSGAWQQLSLPAPGGWLFWLVHGVLLHWVACRTCIMSVVACAFLAQLSYDITSVKLVLLCSPLLESSEATTGVLLRLSMSCGVEADIGFCICPSPLLRGGCD
jgi:hypothetical protein